MTLTEETHKDITVVAIDGRLDANSSDAFSQRMEALVTGGKVRIVVDLRKLEYISSAGLRALLSALRRLDAHDGALVVAGARPFVREIFEVAGLDSVFDMHDGVDEAVAAMQGS